MTIPQHVNLEQKRGIIKTIVIAVFIILLFFGLFLNKILTPRVLSIAELRSNGAIVFDKPRIIKPFSLVDHRGENFDLSRLQGKWSYLFFGFTHCPDICPNTLAKLSEAYNQVSDGARDNMQVILLTVDPARDTPEKLQQYVPFFNPEFLGLSGDFLEIMSLSQNLNAGFTKVPMGDTYTVDHTANVIVINPKGHYHGFLKPPLELAKLKAAMHSIPVHMPD